MVYCLYYGVTNTKVKLHFFALPEAASSKGSSYALCNCPFETIKAANAAILTDVLFKITILISKRILIERFTPNLSNLFLIYLIMFFI